MFAILFVGGFNTLAALGQDNHDTIIPIGEPAYIAETNDIFSVCTFDPERDIFFRWKGVRIQRKDIPKVSAGNFVRIYEQGSRPVYDKNSPEALNPPPEYYHHYGILPSLVKDVDPPLTTSRNGKGEIVIGFVQGLRFYAVTNLGAVAVSNQFLLHGQIIGISMPSNRADEVRQFAEGVLSGVGCRRPLGIGVSH